ncbi:c-type cytochrome domain-containing protein [Pseudomonadota bacterium]
MRTRVLGILMIAATPFFGAGCSQQVSFNNDVKPILEANCMSCHDGKGEGSEKSGFVMLTYDDLMKGTKFGPVVVPGDGASSTLHRLVSHKADPKIHMPPHSSEAKELTDAQKSTIKMWIDQGALNN